MPALDQCHPQVIRALEKDGWEIVASPFTLTVHRDALLFVDVRAQRLENGESKVVLLVEVKCFPEGSSDTRELYIALGQYLIYRSILKQKELAATVYLAVPSDAFHNVISRLGLAAIRDNQVKMVVVDVENGLSSNGCEGTTYAR